MAVLTRVSVGSTVSGNDLGDIAVAADQIFVEVPARDILRPRFGGPFVERMRIRALHDGFCRDRKGNAILVLRGLRDLGRAAGLLSAEIVGGNADDHQAAVVKLGPQLLQSGILRREAAQRRRVDDQQRPAGIVGEPDIAARQRRKRKRIGGDPADRRPAPERVRVEAGPAIAASAAVRMVLRSIMATSSRQVR